VHSFQQDARVHSFQQDARAHSLQKSACEPPRQSDLSDIYNSLAITRVREASTAAGAGKSIRRY
jgi:hypothetical protein